MTAPAIPIIVHGIHYVCDLPSVFILQPEYEPYMPSVIQLPLDGVFIDVGAHVGKYALYGARQCPRGLVVAIEPNPENIKNLESGILRNEFSNVKVFPVACGSYDGQIMLFPTDESSTWKTSHGTGFTLPMPNTIYVRQRPLDDIVKELKLTHIDLIKIDVEQYELDVLRGAVETLIKFKPKLQIEIWDIGDQKRRVYELLIRLGYRVERILASVSVPDVHPNYQDVLFRKFDHDA